VSLVDAEDLPRDTVLESDLCVVGAGAAGLALAVSLEDSGLRVLVLESGGLTFDPRAHALADFETIGAPLRATQPVRQRRFGGSTSTWHGRLAPLDEIDFESRPWVAHSGWPVAPEEVYEYAPRAARFFGLERADFQLDAWSPDAAIHCLSGDGLSAGVHLWPRDINTAGLHLSRLRAGANVRIVLHGVATRLVPDENRSRIVSLTARSLGGNHFVARARIFVLACGGLENPRLLLLSRDSNGHTVGNPHDTVGRFYMNHPRGENVARLYLRSSIRSALGRSLTEHRDVRSGQTVQFSVRPDAGLQRREQLLNACSFFYPQPILERLRAGRRLINRQFMVIDQVEQAPDRASRVTLSDRPDPYGDPQLRLDWRIGEETTRTLRRLHELLNMRFNAAGFGTLESSLTNDPPCDPDYTDASHAMGATRMSDNPRHGVVDADCRVHGVANLFIAGSSVFPTGGQAPPTLTIVCLALRLADHLHRLPTG
jgi:choline dehydrogenase-like flavoprotein